jgi:hypothetical protein
MGVLILGRRNEQNLISVDERCPPLGRIGKQSMIRKKNLMPGFKPTWGCGGARNGGIFYRRNGTLMYFQTIIARVP